jgi:hypothetical protein
MRAKGEHVRLIARLAKETATNIPKLYAFFLVQNAIPTEEQARSMIASLQAKKAKLFPLPPLSHEAPPPR